MSQAQMDAKTRDLVKELESENKELRARLARVATLCRIARHPSNRDVQPNLLWADEVEAALAAAHPVETKPLFEAGVTLDSAAKRLQVALGHIAEGTGKPRGGQP